MDSQRSRTNAGRGRGAHAQNVPIGHEDNGWFPSGMEDNDASFAGSHIEAPPGMLGSGHEAANSPNMDAAASQPGTSMRRRQMEAGHFLEAGHPFHGFSDHRQSMNNPHGNMANLDANFHQQPHISMQSMGRAASQARQQDVAAYGGTAWQHPLGNTATESSLQLRQNIPRIDDPWSGFNTRGRGSDGWIGASAENVQGQPSYITTMDFAPWERNQELNLGRDPGGDSTPQLQENTSSISFNWDVNSTMGDRHTNQPEAAGWGGGPTLSHTNNPGALQGVGDPGPPLGDPGGLRFEMRAHEGTSFGFGAEPTAERFNVFVETGNEDQLSVHPGEPSEVSSSVSTTSRNVETVSNLATTLVCDICAAEFNGNYRQGNLARHMRLQHGGGRGYICAVTSCSRSFRRSDARLKHYRKHHPQLAPPVVTRRGSQRTDL